MLMFPDNVKISDVKCSSLNSEPYCHLCEGGATLHTKLSFLPQNPSGTINLAPKGNPNVPPALPGVYEDFKLKSENVQLFYYEDDTSGEQDSRVVNTPVFGSKGPRFDPRQ